MSRPGDQDPFDQLSPDVQQEIRQRRAGPDGTAPPASAADGEADVEEDRPPVEAEGEAERVLSEIPPLRDDLPDDLGGILLASGPDHRLLRVDWSQRAIGEEELEVQATTEPAGGLVVQQGQVYLGGRDNILRIDPAGEIGIAISPPGQVLPSDEGVAVVVAVEPRRVAGIAPTDLDGSEFVGPWTVGDDVRVLGGWRGTLLVHKAGAVWSLDRDGGSTALARGELVGYDGTNLVLVNCSRVDDCRIEIGTPDRPAQRSVPVPEALHQYDIAAWTTSFALSPDGSRLALATERGVATVLLWIDLETGKDKTVAASLVPGSPVAWSPDGRYLAATVVGQDLVVAREEDRQSWRIDVARSLDGLVWLEPGGS
jgi:hypothetical protein